MSNNRYIIGIGAQKAGTSWLANYLSGHPDVLVTPLKEMHFFDSVYRPDICAGFERRIQRSYIEIAHKLQLADVVRASPKFMRFVTLSDRVRICGKIERYRNYFEQNANNESVFCDITPEYALLDQTGFEAVKSLADDVRLIFLLRNPVDRFWSAMRMVAKRNPEFDVMAEYHRNLDRPHFFQCTDYGKTLSTVYDVFAKEKVFVQFYEHLFNLEIIAQLCRFCDIDYIEPNLEKRVLEGIAFDLPLVTRERIYNKFRHVYEWAENEFGSKLPNTWLADIKSFSK